MSGFVVAALALWVLGVAGFVVLGWDPDEAAWRMFGTGAAAIAMVAALTVGRSRLRPEANVVALLAGFAVLVFLPPPVDGLGASIGLVVAASAVLVGYYTLQLSLRTHAVAGSVLQHGIMRIASTVAVAAVVAILAVVGLRLGSGVVSMRWEQSLDVGSGQFLVAVAVLLMVLVTALSMIAVARTHTDVGEGSDDGSVAESTGQEAG